MTRFVGHSMTATHPSGKQFPGTRPVYLTATGSFLPGEPVGNDEMEARLGMVGDKPSRLRRRVLESNGITSRHYALDADGTQTHLNEELAANAVDRVLAERGIGLQEIGMLAVGTTMPDVLMPGFASMVHGRLGATGEAAAMEVLSTAGICSSGAAALLHAWTAVLADRHDRAIAAGSELPSVMMKASRFHHESAVHKQRDDRAEGFQYFNADFLRWMLSDGAGAVLLESQPNPGGLSLRVDWIELTSYAHEYPVCMHLGTSNPRDVAVGNTWLSVDDPGVAHDEGMLVIRQDIKLLADHLVGVGVEECRRLIKKGRINPELGYDWFLPHMSSYFFKDKLAEAVAEAGLDLPEERWFTNLAAKGNTGAASIYVMLDDALRSGIFEPGDRILAMVPESGRFIISFLQFTVVEPGASS